MAIDTENVVRILLVEDDLLDVELIRQALEASPIKCRLSHCSNGLAALNLLDEIKVAGGNLFDLVLLDLHMPIMSGMEFLASVRIDERFNKLPVVVLTSERNPDILKQALSFGANAACSKSSSQEAMTDIVQAIVDVWAGSIFLERPFLV